MKLEIGVTYYRLTFADRSLTMPDLTPLIFVGRDIFDEGDKLNYFQSTTSLIKFGLLGEHAEITPVDDAELGESLLSIDEVAPSIDSAKERYYKEGNPKLEKVKGKWVSGP